MILSRKIKAAKVYINGALTPFKCLRARRSIGGSEVDMAEIAVPPDRRGYIDRFWIGRTGPYRMGQTVEITVDTSQGERVIHFGALAMEDCKIEDEEQVILVSRLEPWLFGRPALWQFHQNPHFGKSAVQLSRELRFNPVVDGIAVPNMGTVQGIPAGRLSNEIFAPGTPTLINGPTFRDPETHVRKADGAFNLWPVFPASFWTLADVVNYLCVTLNGEARFIYNQPFNALREVFRDTGQAVRDYVVPAGTYLPRALDELLEPLGFTWWVELSKRNERQLRFAHHRHGRGRFTAKLQKPTDRRISLDPIAAIDLNRSNVLHAHLVMDGRGMVNQMTVVGGTAMVEGTFKLLPAWPAEDDNQHPLINTPVIVDQISGVKTPNPAFKPDPWRKWVWNEAGDYLHLATDADDEYLRPPNLQTLFFNDRLDDVRLPNDFHAMADAANDGNAAEVANALAAGFVDPISRTVQRRRRFLPMLTLGADGKPLGEIGGCRLEYRIRNESPGEGDPFSPWLPIVSGVQILDSECGIYFDGEEGPPPEMVANSSALVEVRITACVELDNRLQASSTVSAASLHLRTLQHAVDLERDFNVWIRSTTSIFYADPRYRSDARDDRAAALCHAFRLRNGSDMAEVRGTISLHGTDDPAVDLGQQLWGIEGRNFWFNSYNSAHLTHYPLIAAITYDVQNQITQLELSRARRFFVESQR